MTDNATPRNEARFRVDGRDFDSAEAVNRYLVDEHTKAELIDLLMVFIEESVDRDAALDHARQQGREEAAQRLAPYLRHRSTCNLQAVRDNHPSDPDCNCGLREVFDAIASPSEEPKPSGRDCPDIECMAEQGCADCAATCTEHDHPTPLHGRPSDKPKE